MHISRHGLTMRPARFLAASGLAALFLAACGGSHSSSPAPVTQPSISVYAGSAGGRGVVDGPGPAARFNSPASLAFDPQGQLLVADANNRVIRRVDPATGKTSLFAGKYGATMVLDGPLPEARFALSLGMAASSDRTIIHFTDLQMNGIRTLDLRNQLVTTLLPGGTYTLTDGVGPNVRFNMPTALALDEPAGYLYVADYLNAVIRRVNVATSETTTVAGKKNLEKTQDGPFETALFNYPNALAGPVNDVLYVGCTDSVRAVDLRNRKVTTLAGTPNVVGFADGAGSQAKFNGISGLALDGQGRLLVTEGRSANNQCGQILRSVDLASGQVTTLAGTGSDVADAEGIVRGLGGWADGTGPEVRFNQPTTILVDGRGFAYISDRANSVIRKMDLATNRVWTLAGTGPQVGSADGPPAQASFNLPYGITRDAAGNVYVAEYMNNLVRKITPQGIVSTLAGKAGMYGSTDGKGDAARFSNPVDLAADAAGNLYVADVGNNCIRKITRDGTVSLFAGDPDNPGWVDGQGKAAQFYSPSGIIMGSDGLLYVADTGNNRIRTITQDGTVATFAGSGAFALTDGIRAAAAFGNPRGLTEDGKGHLYVADTYNQAIRAIDMATGMVTTVAGGSAGFADGLGQAASFQSPYRITVDPRGFLLVADRDNNAIRKVTLDGQVTTVVGRSQNSGPSLKGIMLGDLPGQVTAPTGLAIAPDGALLVISDNCVLKVSGIQ